MSILAAWALVIAAAVLLLVASDVDRHDPPDWSLYLALFLLLAWLPAWYVYTALCWAFWGATAGMRCLAICVVDRDGSLPGVARSALRATALVLFTAPAVLGPILAAAAVSLRTAGPWYVALPILLTVCASAAACASPLFARDGRAWHDRLSGTYVIGAPRLNLSERAR